MLKMQPGLGPSYRQRVPVPPPRAPRPARAGSRNQGSPALIRVRPPPVRDKGSRATVCPSPPRPSDRSAGFVAEPGRCRLSPIAG
jgi:hypothetical protein